MVSPIRVMPCSNLGRIELQWSVAISAVSVDCHEACSRPRSCQYAAMIESHPTKWRKTQQRTQDRLASGHSVGADRGVMHALSSRSDGEPSPLPKGSTPPGTLPFSTNVKPTPSSVVRDLRRLVADVWRVDRAGLELSGEGRCRMVPYSSPNKQPWATFISRASIPKSPG